MFSCVFPNRKRNIPKNISQLYHKHSFILKSFSWDQNWIVIYISLYLGLWHSLRFPVWVKYSHKCKLTVAYLFFFPLSRCSLHLYSQEAAVKYTLWLLVKTYYSTGKPHQNEGCFEILCRSQCKMLGGNIHKFALFTYKKFVINLWKFIFFQFGNNSIFLSKYCKHV